MSAEQSSPLDGVRDRNAELPQKLRTIVERSPRLTQRQQWAYLEAADEIERLRRDLQSMKERWDSIKWCSHGCGENNTQSNGGPTIGGGFGIL